jgi:8-oxo-dGTP pyrophosphatase MutT (NUDIX family)
MSHLNQLTEAEIARRLAERPLIADEPPYPPGFLKGELRPAAVLIPLLLKDGDWHVLYIRRTTNSNDPHGGQVAFPGGAANPDDSDAETTAMREAQEEIGLLPSDVRIVGRLVDFVTITSYKVTPVVGIIPWPYPLVLQADEVSRAFIVPLQWLADPSNHSEEERSLPPPFSPIPVIYYKPFDGETLWGASARFTLELVNSLLG